MSKSFQLLLALITLIVFANSCNQSKSSNPDLVGNWKMHALRLHDFDNQITQISGQIKSLSDSMAIAKDSVSQMRFQSQLDQYQHYLAEMNGRKDSSLKNTRWIFESDNRFEDRESDNKTYKGYWEYNDKTKMLTRYLAADSLKIDVKGDTLSVAFDSLNHLIFVKTK